MRADGDGSKLPAIEVCLDHSGIKTLAIWHARTSEPVFSIPFRHVSNLTAAAVGPDTILAFGSSTEEIALVDAFSGEVIRRGRRPEGCGSCCVVRERGKIVFFGSRPVLQIFNASDLSIEKTYDELQIHGNAARLIATSDYYRLGQTPGRIFHTPVLEEDYFSFGKERIFYRFQDAVVTPSGTVLLTAFDESLISSPFEKRKWRYQLCEIDLNGSEVKIHARYESTELDAKRRLRPAFILKPDGSTWIDYRTGTPLNVSASLFEFPCPQVAFTKTWTGDDKLSDKDRGARAEYVDHLTINRYRLNDWTAAECANVLRDMASRIGSDVSQLVWGERLQFAYCIGGNSIDEGRFFSEMVHRELDVVAALRELLTSYLDGAKTIKHTHFLRTHDGITAMGPAMRALILLDPTALDILAAFLKFQDVEHEEYCGNVILPDFAERHGWTSQEAVTVGMDYLLNCDARAPQDSMGLGLISDALKFMTPDAFTTLLLRRPSVVDDLKSVEDGHEGSFVIEDFLGRFDSSDASTTAVVAAVEKRLGRPALRQ